MVSGRRELRRALKAMEAHRLVAIATRRPRLRLRLSADPLVQSLFNDRRE